jgi:hypothetical protein
MKRSLVGIAFAAAAFVALSDAASAERKCVLDPKTGEIRCTIVAEPAPDAVIRLGESDLVWRRIGWRVDDDLVRGIGCIRDVAGVTEIGAAYFITLENTATNEAILTETVCTFPGDPPPEPPPPPPSLREFEEAAAQALTLPTSLNPRAEFGGITGLDTWLWCVDPGTQTVTVSLRGWTAVADVDTVEFTWQIEGIAATTVRADGCGSEDKPAAIWQPQTKGDWSVALSTTWAGTWALSFQGLATGVFPLGPITLTSAAVPYPVDEFVGVLVAEIPRGDG